MFHDYSRRFAFVNLVLLAVLIYGPFLSADQPAATADQALTLVVMDPLCDKLACDCVQGYAQRKYEVLGETLTEKLGRPVNVLWGNSISAALEETDATADIVIGKHSVIQHEADQLNLELLPVAALTGTDGSTTQTGLVVVRKLDPAFSVADLAGYRIFFGPTDCDEKNLAPIKLLQENGIEIPANLETSGACSEAATKLMELDSDIEAAAIISSYAEPLLAGCGTIEKGDLRVIGTSQPVPFITVFLNDDLSAQTRKQIADTLIDECKQPKLLKALETKTGFVPFVVVADAVGDAASARSSGTSADDKTTSAPLKKKQ